jgi:hypothetical protein
MFAYLGTLAGIVLALLVSLSALLATPPDQPPIAPHNIATTLTPSGSQVATKASIMAPQIGKWGPRVAHSVMESTTAPQTKVAVFSHGKALAANEASREQRLQPLDLRAHTKQRESQQQPGGVDRRMGYAQEPTNAYNRIW